MHLSFFLQFLNIELLKYKIWSFESNKKYKNKIMWNIITSNRLLDKKRKQ